MPGRGRPWRGVGQGNQDRIGTEAIADGSITEADLDSSVTSKLNSTGGHGIQDEGTPLTQRPNMNFVGDGVVASDNGEDTIVTIAGGGGGGTGFPDTVPTPDILYYDDFIDYVLNSEFASRYFIVTTNGLVDVADGSNGLATLKTGATAGSHTYMSTSATMGNFTSGVRMDGRTRFGAPNATFPTAELMMFIGWNLAGEGGVDTTSAATFETALLSGAWFRFDPQNDANFQAVVSDELGTTVIDTGVAPGITEDAAMQDLRITLVPTSPGSITGTTTWFIDGVQVAQTTSNFPVGPDAGTGSFAKLCFFVSITTLDAFNESGVADYIYLLCERKPQPIEGD